MPDNHVRVIVAAPSRTIWYPILAVPSAREKARLFWRPELYCCRSRRERPENCDSRVTGIRAHRQPDYRVVAVPNFLIINIVGYGGRPPLVRDDRRAAISMAVANATKSTCLISPLSGSPSFPRRLPRSSLEKKLGFGIIIGQIRYVN